MKKILILMCMVSALVSCKQESKQVVEVTYPETRKVDTVDTYFGTEIKDPYRWLEDDRSDETAAWVKAQNEVTFGYLEKIPFRNQIKNKLEDLWNYEKIGAPFTEGDYTFYLKNDGLQNQYVLYKRDKDGNEEIFLDPNNFSEDGTTSLAGLEFSKDSKTVAYAISEGGSDWRKVIIMDVTSKAILEDTLTDIKFSGLSWKGNEGFYYSSYDKPTGSELSAMTDQHKLYYHTLGTPQSEDKIVFGLGQKRRYIGGHVTQDDKYLIITAANSTYGNELYIQDLTNPNSKIVTLVNNFDNDHYVIENDGDKLFIVTDKDAPNRKIVIADAKNPSAPWVDFIPETENVLSPSTGSGYFFAHYMKDAISQVKQYDYHGNLVREVELPGVGSVGGFGGKKEDTTLYFTFTNYITAGTIYSYEPKEGKTAVYEKSKAKFNSDDYESKQVFYTSKDGTKIPMIISHKKGIQLNGKNPTILYGYGGFNVSLTPGFSIANAVWMENGGIYAVPNLRGGGEYGKQWHLAGTQTRKQNVFDDFIAAGEFLIENGYTSPDYLAIRGGSNGGLLVGACMTQRPDLFKVALPAVGVLDMLRYHTFTAGAGWAYDYGTAGQSKEMFEYLLGYSPVHNIKPGVEYPATLITTADHDDRVVPAHSFKFAAGLQENQHGTNPVLIRVDVNAGHGAGKPLSKTIEENADIQSFTLFNMGVRPLGS
ncbi:prolyl oligopeptidase family protein [Proteiniphilum sp. X52]|uniref:prolyl oligopeptidase family serine peptidase n=1 Tax=Proteiniphilum sp. X52 TaxID=2382159 RepID=UPI001624B894|nr:prolyl oligopeptidase family serine peptidase [Proteiniphilum sp. X52]